MNILFVEFDKPLFRPFVSPPIVTNAHSIFDFFCLDPAAAAAATAAATTAFRLSRQVFCQKIIQQEGSLDATVQTTRPVRVAEYQIASAEQVTHSSISVTMSNYLDPSL